MKFAKAKLNKVDSDDYDEDEDDDDDNVSSSDSAYDVDDEDGQDGEDGENVADGSKRGENQLLETHTDDTEFSTSTNESSEDSSPRNGEVGVPGTWRGSPFSREAIAAQVDLILSEPHTTATVGSPPNIKPNKEGLVSIPGILSKARENATRFDKVKKKVGFEPDEVMVTVIEIPGRGDSPMFEELEPCDPDRLADEVEMEIQGDVLGGNFNVRKSGHRRSLDLVARITGAHMGYGYSVKTPFKSPSGKNGPSCSSPTGKRTSNARGAKTDRGTRPRKNTNIKVSTSMEYEDEFTLQRFNTSDSRNRPRSSRHSREGELRDSKESAKHKCPHAGHNSNCSGAKTLEKLRPRTTGKTNMISLDTKSLTSGTPLRVSSEALGSPPTPAVARLHSSPYRSFGGRPSALRVESTLPVTAELYSTISPELTSSNRETKAHVESGRLLSEYPAKRAGQNVSQNKLHAWNMANGNVRSPQICISQLWDNASKANLDFLSS